MTTPHHRVRHSLHADRTFGQRAADALVAGMGSWAFLLSQSAVLLIWVLLNVTAWIHHWDPYPFLLGNICLSLQAAYASPIILMSGNRQAAKDRARDNLEADEVHAVFQVLHAVQQVTDAVHALSQQHGETLQGQDEMLAAIHALQTALDAHLRAALPPKE